MKLWGLAMCFMIVLAKEDITLGNSEANPASSCNEIYQHNPTTRGTIDQYWIKTDEGKFKVTCNMKLKCGGVEGGWMQVVDVDMNRDDNCPGTWGITAIPRNLCLGISTAGCATALFSVKGVSYSNICGQLKGYQKGATEAFNSGQSIDATYVDGVSITVDSPRKHVWTYAAGRTDDYNIDKSNCPCAVYPGNNPPAFVGNDYYCESGDIGTNQLEPYYLSDPLWDGYGCTTDNGCCARIGMPWFYRKLPTVQMSNIEIRICKSGSSRDEDIGIEKAEVFVL